MFSSDNVDSGTQLLLSVFSRILDEHRAGERPLPRRILDAGCGVGVIGICAASAISALDAIHSQVYVRCQDRDELARLVTLHNAAKNGISPAMLEAHTEPLLAGPGPWDLVLSNIPAKAGEPVLEDFVHRSTSLLNPGGRVIVVIVRTLADFFRARIAEAGAELFLEKKGPAHVVFVYGGVVSQNVFPDDSMRAEHTPSLQDGVIDAGQSFFARYPFYFRASASYKIEDIPVSIETIHGASGFDAPGGVVLAAAKLIRRIGSPKLIVNSTAVLLVHEPGQGFFARWLLEFFRDNSGKDRTLVFSGRNILALEAARHNIPQASILPVADLRLGASALRETAGAQKYSFIAAFPELLPQSSLPKMHKDRQMADQLAALWDALPLLLAEAGVFIVAFSSSEAERFDRKKPSGYTRLGSVKRNGFRALAYRLNE